MASSLTTLIDLSKPSLIACVASIAFNPTAWNIVARNGVSPTLLSPLRACTDPRALSRAEYRNKTITRIFGGNARYGCYFLALCIFSAGMLRDSLYVPYNMTLPRSPPLTRLRRYHRALLEQPQVKLLPEPLDTLIPAVLFGLGQIFVVTSTWALGVTGTFLGDYFGILMDHRVEGFPFNVLRDPMYVGSTMSFAATALW